jgi:hypothetical protein
MITLGIVLLIVGYVLEAMVVQAPLFELAHVAVIIGWILLIVGVILWVLGGVGGGRYRVGGRRHWY